jgi:hypothetical protein
MENNSETVAPVTVPNRQGMIEQIIAKLMSGESWLSYSSLSCFKGSPKDFIDYKLKQRVETDAMVYGSMVHCLVLEPEDFENRYMVIQDDEICASIGGAKPRATNAYKAWKEEQLAAAGERIIVDTNDFKNAQIVAFNVRNNRASRKVLSLCPEREKPIEWEFQNFKFKGFIDGFGEKAIFDLKTCPDAQQGKFQRDIINNDYYLQAAMYLYGSGIGVTDYFIIAADKVGGISVHQLDVHLLEYGMKEYTYLLERFNECILSDRFDESYDFWSKRHDGIYIAERSTKMFEAL